MVLSNTLIRLIEPDLCVRAFLCNMDFIAAVLVDPFDGWGFLTRYHCLLPLREWSSLSIYKCISENGFFLLELRADFEAVCSITVCITEREFIKGEAEGALAMLVEPVFVFLQLLDETGLDLEFWSARIQVFKRLDH